MRSKSKHLSGLAALILYTGGLAAQDSPPDEAKPGPRLELMELRELPLRQALRLISEQTELNFAPSAAAAEVKVSMFLRKVAAMDALDVLCKAHDLWYRQDPASGIIRIHTAAEYRKDVQSFRDDRIETFTLSFPNALDVAFAIQELFGARVQFQNNTFRQFQSQQELQQRLSRFDIVDQRGQGFGNQAGGNQNQNQNQNNRNQNGLQNQALLAGQRTRGGNQGNQGGAAQDFVQRQDIQANRGLIEGLTGEQIQALDDAAREGVATPEVLSRLLGRASIFVSVIQRLNKLIVRTGDARALDQIRELVTKLDVATPTVLLEVKVLSIELGDDFNSVFDYQFSDASTAAGGFTTGDVLPPASDAISGNSARRSLPLALLGGGLRPDNLIFQYVHRHFRARMQLLENKNRVTLLATPMLLTANNEVSRLFIGDNRPVLQNFTPGQNIVVNGAVTTTTPVPQFQNVDVGTSLLITPNVNADKTVTLRLVQENSQVIPGGATILVPEGNGFVSRAVDIVQSRTLSGTVIAKDRLSLAVGGLIEEGVSDQRAEVPWLGRLPLLGFFFRREDRRRFRRELVIVVRPYVLNSPGEGAATSKRLLDELSLHPNAPEAKGTLGTYGPDDVIRPAAPSKGLKKLLRFHSIDLEND